MQWARETLHTLTVVEDKSITVHEVRRISKGDEWVVGGTCECSTNRCQKWDIKEQHGFADWRHVDRLAPRRTAQRRSIDRSGLLKSTEPPKSRPSGRSAMHLVHSREVTH